MLRSFADGSLKGSSTGAGVPAVLALHGWARSHRDFDRVLTGVAPAAGASADPGAPAAPGLPADPQADPELDAIALDLPGFGAAPEPPGPWGSADYAAAIAPVLDEMTDQVVVLGHSFGGRVAVQLAARRPERVRALVLTGVPLARPPGAPRRPPAAFRLVRALHRAGLVGDRRIEAARQRHGSEDYRNARGVMRQVLVASLAERYEELLAAVSCPLWLVWGEDDPVTPLSVAEAVVGLVPGARLDVWPGAGHLTPLTIPAELHRAARRALA